MALCRALNVSTSGFYAWCQRKDVPKSSNEKLKQKRLKFIETIFNESHQVYGYRKIHAALKKYGVMCSLNTVHAECKELGIKSRVRKKYRVCTTDSNHKNSVSDNVLARDFEAHAPNEKGVTDITYLETKEGWLFVVAIIDLFSRKIIGYAMADHMRTELVVSALRCALSTGRKPTGPIWLHSDRGVQFTADMFRDALKLAGIEQSMSRKGNCWDNAPCESWFGKLKTEWVYVREKVYATRTEAMASVMEYIEMFYNSQRLHQSLGYQTPNEFELQYYQRKEVLTPASQ